jgi:hypothetical protein
MEKISVWRFFKEFFYFYHFIRFWMEIIDLDQGLFEFRLSFWWVAFDAHERHAMGEWFCSDYRDTRENLTLWSIFRLLLYCILCFLWYVFPRKIYFGYAADWGCFWCQWQCLLTITVGALLKWRGMELITFRLFASKSL